MDTSWIGIAGFIGILSSLPFILVGFICVAVSAFSKGLIWGLGVFFFPIIAIPFSIKHWPEASYGAGLFLKGFTGLVISFLLVHFFMP